MCDGRCAHGGHSRHRASRCDRTREARSRGRPRGPRWRASQVGRWRSQSGRWRRGPRARGRLDADVERTGAGRQDPRALRARRRSCQQRWSAVRLAQGDPGGVRADLRPEPPRAVLAYEPAARSPYGRPCCDHRFGCSQVRAPGSRRPAIGEVLLRAVRYGTSKLCNVLFTRELARRAPELHANCFHPGVVRTGFAKNEDGVWKVVARLGAPFFRSPERGARSLVWLALSDNAAALTGEYIVDEKSCPRAPGPGMTTSHEASGNEARSSSACLSTRAVDATGPETLPQPSPGIRPSPPTPLATKARPDPFDSPRFGRRRESRDRRFARRRGPVMRDLLLRSHAHGRVPDSRGSPCPDTGRP